MTTEPNSSYEVPPEYETPWKEKGLKEEYRISLVKELSPQEHIKEQIAWLRGEVWDATEQKFIPIKGMTPFMNSEGIEMYFQFTTAILSPMVTFSNYGSDKKLIHQLIMMVVKNASIHFRLHWKDYGISRKTKITVLVDKLMILGLSAMYKAIGAGERKAATSNISESISNIQRSGGFPEQQTKKGLFGMFKG